MKKQIHITGKEKLYAQDANILSTTNLKGQITYCNDQFADISGFTREELQGKSHNIVRHPDMPKEAFAGLWQTVKRGKSWMGIVKNRCKNGDHYWVDAYVTPILKGGAVVEYQSVRNKPAKEHVERAEKLYAQINAGRSPLGLRYGRLPYSVFLLMALFITVIVSVSVAALMGSNHGYAGVDGLVAGSGVAVILAYWLSHPISKLKKKARSIIKDPVASYVYTGRFDEIGDVFLALKYAESETRGVVGRIADSSEEIIRAVGDLSSAIHLNVKGIGQQHLETDQVASAVTQLAATIKEVASNTNQSAETASLAEEEARSSIEIVAETMEAIQGLTSEVETAHSVIQRLESDSENIASIINVITAIFEQTNLLALNAAIEAARAGEQGRGFAVVAEEVRTLATRTYEATQEIQTIIGSLQSVAAEAIGAIKRSLAMADGTLVQAQKTVGLLDKISQAVSSICDVNAQIATAMTEQNVVTQELDRNVVNIRDVSELSVDATSYADRSIESMEELVSNLNGLSEQRPRQVQ
ncbi:methyl-accepting chemotaxis protein [Solemya velesiana gill symbiont]|uniref:Chemotaxis protein n=1 Tax=Solemya velesiana gill symbiont TaxID=1918948 RepID=A0A1T2KQQ2_9GAMM|nr:PAS domain-containing methyl-accepting chemotaxis protein [Solemya velesiana gill symbiont]OOZ35183.1 hypothetical protein BOW51_11515 [Solemya velesiana gill symbiont]